ncbi:MAG: hypothetical protein K0M40_00075 [Prolixibacteraceae bacterium]|nr:hypothetical protein [Prolixibacteraceae bacterium]
MIICKKLDRSDSICSLEEWFLKCPPQGKKKHWVPYRSAFETAKLWLRGIPKQFIEIFKNCDLEIEYCAPELNTRFDRYKGNVRNHDLLIIAKDQKNEKVVVSIESKVDEPYGRTIGPYLNSIRRKKEEGKNSNADYRIEDLRKVIFPQVDVIVFESLKYQLLTAVAGTLREAKIQGAKKAIFLVQTLKPSNINEGKNRKNQRDLDHFIKVISNGKYANIHDNDLFGPFKFTGNQFIPDDVELWIGKYSVEI